MIQKRFLVLILTAVLTSVIVLGCTDANNVNKNTGQQVLPSPSSSQQVNTQGQTKVQGNLNIHLKLESTTLNATLEDNATSRDFVSLLPLTLTLEDYAETEKISDLPRRLSIEGAPPGSDPREGDLAYYAPWGNLALFYKDFGYSSGLVKLGRIDSEVEVLKNPGSLRVTIELVEK
jgi:hypothetical protein